MRHAARAWLGRHALTGFFTLAGLLTWSQWLPLALAHRVVRAGPEPSHFPGLFGPCVAAFAMAWMTEGRAGVSDLLRRMVRWRVAPAWYAVALSPLASVALALAVMRARGESLPAFADFGRMGGIASLPPALMLLALVPLNGYSEEVGWRGFALPRMQRRRGALAASLLLALPWALWHVPSFFVLESYRGLGPAMFPGFLLGLACGSIVLAWLFNRTGGSLLLVSLFHGALNFASATLAARGTVAVVVTTVVMLNALVLVAITWRARARGVRGPMEPAAAP